MTALNSLNASIRKLSSLSVAKIRGRQQSVVYMNDDGSIDWPANPNSTGVLCVPTPYTSDEWQAKHGKQS